MKVVCISNEVSYNKSHILTNITVGKIYDADDIAMHYSIIDDSGKEYWYNKTNFIMLEEYRQKQLDLILDPLVIK